MKSRDNQRLLKSFHSLWSDLFSKPIHLDSALSKQPKDLKPLLAPVLNTVLMRPASTAETLGIGIPPGEPWSLSLAEMRSWRPATLIAEKLFDVQTKDGLRFLEQNPTVGDFPEALLRDWDSSWGLDRRNELVRILGKEAPLSLRVSHRLGASVLLERIVESDRAKLLPSGIDARLSERVPTAVRLSGYVPVLGWSEHEQGLFEIQDEGSQLMALFSIWPEVFGVHLQKQPHGWLEVGKGPDKVSRIPDSVPNWTFVDACAGAGGKTLAVADALRGKGRVYAYDTSVKKLQALKRRYSRTGYTNVQTVSVKEGEEEGVVNRFRRRAQVVLVDAPCGGWGVLRRNPDIKWRQAPDVLDRMPQLQLRLLSLYSDLVAPGGRIVYGVCTFRAAETLEVIRDFLRSNPGFHATEGGFLGPGPCDGFFMQALSRREK